MPNPNMPGAKVLLLGSSGSGKTYSAASLADCGLDVRYLWLEPGYDSTARYFADAGRPIPDNVHWVNVPLTPISFAEMRNTADIMNRLSFEGMANWNDPNRDKHRSFYNCLGALCEYKDERTGQNLGCADDWDNNVVLVIESLSALTEMAVRQLVGQKPVFGLNIIGVAQQAIGQFLHKICALKCHVVLTAHVEREVDETMGGTKIMASTVGRKLAPKVPTFFSDVIHVKREGRKFSWATDTVEVDLKTRLLPLASGLTPTFHDLMAKWKTLRDLAEPGPTAKAGNQA